MICWNGTVLLLLGRLMFEAIGSSCWRIDVIYSLRLSRVELEDGVLHHIHVGLRSVVCRVVSLW